MRIHCIAALPHSTWSYTWKAPTTPQMRPALGVQAHHSTPRAEARLRRAVLKAECSSVPWRTYLASREFKNLASDIADAVFSPSSTRLSSGDTERPSSLTANAFGRAAIQLSAGSLLASVLPDAAEGARSNAEMKAPGLALAA